MTTALTQLGRDHYSHINSGFRKLVDAHHPLIVVHRGSQGGTIVENTAKAVHAAVAQGADIVEIDVIRSTDGEFYVFHNGYEKMHFDLDVDIRTLSSAEIDELQYGWVIKQGAERCGVEKLGALLGACPDTYLNIDRSWDYWDTLLDFLAERDVEKRILLKSPARAEILQVLDDHPTPFPFMPIVESRAELDLVLGFTGLNTIAVEILAKRPEDPLASGQIIDDLRRQGLLIHLNALNLANRRPLFLGWDDENSVLEGPETGWGRLIDHGADIIQTDWPALLHQYRNARRP